MYLFISNVSDMSIGGKAPTKAVVKGGKAVAAVKGVAPTKMKGKKRRKSVLLIPCIKYLLMGITQRPNMSALFTARIDPFLIQGKKVYFYILGWSTHMYYLNICMHKYLFIYIYMCLYTYYMYYIDP
jgi:hypothetical protein